MAKGKRKKYRTAIIESPEQSTRSRTQILLPFAFCPLPFAFALRVLPYCVLPYCVLPFALALCSAVSFAQERPTEPYATINRDAVSYNGPRRDVAYDLGGSEIHLGLLVPLTGPRQAEGEALRHAAEMAIEQENAISLPGGRHLALSTRDETGPWGRASSEVVHMMFEDQAVAIITSADGGAAHLAVQVGNKVGVPILTLSTDATTTEINLPWIFRLGPTDVGQAQAFARDIYHDRKLQRVGLLVQDDHDGRVGSEEFEKAAREVHAPAPMRITIGPGMQDSEAFEGRLREAQAVVVWTDAATANLLMARVRSVLPSAPLYLCRKAAQGDCTGDAPSRTNFGASGAEGAGIWTAEETLAQSAVQDAFVKRCRQRFGTEPGIGAAQAYDAVRVLAASLRRSGPSRARLRDALAEVSAFEGVSGIISFDHAGNDISHVIVLKLR
jgi:branched-chain amino acid transport system substrate-binding protein